jgi:hypothetical protein
LCFAFRSVLKKAKKERENWEGTYRAVPSRRSGLYRGLRADLNFFATCPDPLAPNWDTPPTIVPTCWIAKLKEKKNVIKTKKKKRIAKKRERQQ